MAKGESGWRKLYHYQRLTKNVICPKFIYKLYEEGIGLTRGR